jgi:hypothetical protein
MRVLLVGRQPDRDRLRPQLIEAGWEIAAEALIQPAPAALPGDIDAIVVAPSPAGDVLIAHSRERDEIAEPLTGREREVLARLAGTSQQGDRSRAWHQRSDGQVPWPRSWASSVRPTGPMRSAARFAAA